ncbi:MAG: NUDIX domain-containing protein [Aggregatilineales bacterium]
MAKPTIQKVFAYVTSGQRLLVFEHPDSPEAGIQVPAGTLETGETIAEGVMREAYEETGLSDLILGVFLGEQVCDMSDYGKHEIHRRHFYHVICAGDVPDHWQHLEKFHSGGSPRETPFDLYWVYLPDGVPELIADHGVMVGALLTALKLV